MHHIFAHFCIFGVVIFQTQPEVNFPAACYSDAIQDEKIKGTTYYKIVSEAFLVAGDFRLGIGIDWSAEAPAEPDRVKFHNKKEVGLFLCRLDDVKRPP